jgi:PTS system fructose-specific IIC component/PTS system nitrogen regulatory IIA component
MMFLQDVFLPQYIKMDLEAEDKDEAFEEMVAHFCHVANLNLNEEILGVLRSREAKMSTGIKKGIAIPHGNTDALDKVCGVLGISRKGIDYDALDGEPVYLLFMLFGPNKDTETHLLILQRLAELLDNPQFYTDLRSQKDPGSIHKITCKYEDMLVALD